MPSRNWPPDLSKSMEQLLAGSAEATVSWTRSTLAKICGNGGLDLRDLFALRIGSRSRSSSFRPPLTGEGRKVRCKGISPVGMAREGGFSGRMAARMDRTESSYSAATANPLTSLPSGHASRLFRDYASTGLPFGSGAIVRSAFKGGKCPSRRRFLAWQLSPLTHVSIPKPRSSSRGNTAC